MKQPRIINFKVVNQREDQIAVPQQIVENNYGFSPIVSSGLLTIPVRYPIFETADGIQYLYHGKENPAIGIRGEVEEETRIWKKIFADELVAVANRTETIKIRKMKIYA